MHLFVRQDSDLFRRWINCLAALLIPGSAHWTSGKRRNATIWFLSYLAYRLTTVALSLYPGSSFTPLNVHPIEWLGLLYFLCLLVSSWRCNIHTANTNIVKFIGTWFVGLLLLPLSLNHLFLTPLFAPNLAMEPELNRKDYLYVNRLAYLSYEPQRGDIVLFNTQGIAHPQVKENHQYLKRIVGLPGENIRIEPPNILINGAPLTSAPFFQLSKQTDKHAGYQLATPFPTMQFILNTPEDSITLKEDEFLVFSDNPESPDSRNWGPIKRKNLLGKAYYICAPAERKRYID